MRAASPRWTASMSRSARLGCALATSSSNKGTIDREHPLQVIEESLFMRCSLCRCWRPLKWWFDIGGPRDSSTEKKPVWQSRKRDSLVQSAKCEAARRLCANNSRIFHLRPRLSGLGLKRGEEL